MKTALTDAIVKRIIPPVTGQLEVWDTVTPDLYLRVSQGGTRRWMRRFYANGARVRELLGTWPEMNVYDARARVKLVEIAPTAARQRFGSVAGSFMAQATLAESTRSGWQGWLDREIIPAIGSLDPADGTVFRGAVKAMLDRIAKRSPYARNRAFEVVRRIYNWGIGADLIEPGMALQGIPKLPETARERVLSEDEIKRLLAASVLDYPEWRIYWRLLLYTGTRRGTVLAAKWADIDEGQKALLVPSANLKGKAGQRRATVIPLTEPLQKALAFQREITGHLPWIVANVKTGGAMTNPQKAADRVFERAGISDAHVHDIRHTVATGLGRLRVQPHIIDHVLHHASGSSISRTYNAWAYFDEKREALEKWADYLESLAPARPAKTKGTSKRAKGQEVGEASRTPRQTGQRRS